MAKMLDKEVIEFMKTELSILELVLGEPGEVVELVEAEIKLSNIETIFKPESMETSSGIWVSPLIVEKNSETDWELRSDWFKTDSVIEIMLSLCCCFFVCSVTDK